MKVLRSKNVTTDTARPGQAPAVVFSSGALFFTHVMPWPSGVEGKELAALVALSLEDISPFALESLAWGFCCDEQSRTIFLYAACLPRISVAEQEQWPLAAQVYPAFLPLVAARADEAAGQGGGGGSSALNESGQQAKAGGARSGEQQSHLPAAEHSDSGAQGLPYATVAGATKTQPVQRELLLVGREVVLIEREAGSRWPRRIYSEPLEPQAEVTAQAAREAAVRLLLRCGAATGASTADTALAALPFWRLADTVLSRRGEVRFLLQTLATDGDTGATQGGAVGATLGGAAEVPLSGATEATRLQHGAGGEHSLSGANSPQPLHRSDAGQSLQTVLSGEEALWQADLRTDDFIAFTRKRRLADLRLWYGLCAAAAAAVVLLLLLLGFGWLGGALKERTAKLAVQAPAVERIRQDQDLLMRMRQFSADPFAPFSLIGALKTGKPDPIYFDSIELSGPDAVLVEGQGPTVDAVNAYMRALEQSGGFRAARQARMNLKDGASVFTLYLQYLGQPQLANGAQPAQEAAPVAGSGSAGVDAGRGTGSAISQVSPAQSGGASSVSSASPAYSGGASSVASPSVSSAGASASSAQAAADPAITPLPDATFLPPFADLPEAAQAGAGYSGRGITSVEHRVSQGDTIATIASRYDVPIGVILIANPGLDPRSLSVGQPIRIPRP